MIWFAIHARRIHGVRFGTTLALRSRDYDRPLLQLSERDEAVSTWKDTDDVDGVRFGGSHRCVFSRAADAVAALRLDQLYHRRAEAFTPRVPIRVRP